MTTELTDPLVRLIGAKEAAAACYVEKRRGGVCVFTNGVFDILHRGHLEYLKEARALGNILIVGLNSDDSVRRLKGPSRPLVSELDRAYALLSLRIVDYAVIFDTDTPAELIKVIEPSILVKGGDYKPEQIAGYESVIKSGGRVVTLNFVDGYSTSGMVQKIQNSSE